MVRYEFSKDFKEWTATINGEDIHKRIEDGSYCVRTGYSLGETVLTDTLTFDIASDYETRLAFVGDDPYIYCRAYKDEVLTFVGILSDDFDSKIETAEVVSYTLKYEHLHQLFEDVEFGGEEDTIYQQEDGIKVLDSTDEAHSLVHILVGKLFAANPDFAFTFQSDIEMPYDVLYYKASPSDKVIDLLMTILTENGLTYMLNILDFNIIDVIPTITEGKEIYDIEADARIEHKAWINRDVPPAKIFYYQTVENQVVFDNTKGGFFGGFTYWAWGFNFNETYDLTFPSEGDGVEMEDVVITDVKCGAIEYDLAYTYNGDRTATVTGNTNALIRTYSGTKIIATVTYKITKTIVVGKENDLDPVDAVSIFSEEQAERYIKAMEVQKAQESEEWTFYSKEKLELGDVVQIYGIPSSVLRIREIEDTDDIFGGYTYSAYPYTEPVNDWTQVGFPEPSLNPSVEYYPLDIEASAQLIVKSGEFINNPVRFYLRSENPTGQPVAYYEGQALEVKQDMPENPTQPSDYNGYTGNWYFDFNFTDATKTYYVFSAQWDDSSVEKTFGMIFLSDGKDGQDGADAKLLMLSTDNNVFRLKADGTPYDGQKAIVTVNKQGISEDTTFIASNGMPIADNSTEITVTPEMMGLGLPIRFTNIANNMFQNGAELVDGVRWNYSNEVSNYYTVSNNVLTVTDLDITNFALLAGLDISTGANDLFTNGVVWQSEYSDISYTGDSVPRLRLAVYLYYIDKSGSGKFIVLNGGFANISLTEGKIVQYFAPAEIPDDFDHWREQDSYFYVRYDNFTKLSFTQKNSQILLNVGDLEKIFPHFASLSINDKCTLLESLPYAEPGQDVVIGGTLVNGFNFSKLSKEGYYLQKQESVNYEDGLLTIDFTDLPQDYNIRCRLIYKGRVSENSVLYSSIKVLVNEEVDSNGRVYRLQGIDNAKRLAGVSNQNYALSKFKTEFNKISLLQDDTGSIEAEYGIFDILANNINYFIGTKFEIKEISFINLTTSGWYTLFKLLNYTDQQIYDWCMNLPFFTDTYDFPSFDTLQITAQAGSYSDAVTIGSVRDGADGDEPVLASADVLSYTFPANASGIVSATEYQNFKSMIIVSQGNEVFTAVSDSASLTKKTFLLSATGDGITNLSVSGDTISGTADSVMLSDSATITVSIQYMDINGNSGTRSLTISLAKAKDGEAGQYTAYQYALLTSNTSSEGAVWSDEYPAEIPDDMYLWYRVQKVEGGAEPSENGWSEPRLSDGNISKVYGELEVLGSKIALKVTDAGTVETAAGIEVGSVDGDGYILLQADKILLDGSVTANKIDVENLMASELTLNNGGTIKSQNFVQDTSGFQVDSDGNSEFNNTKVRGELFNPYFTISSENRNEINLQSRFDLMTKNTYYASAIVTLLREKFGDVLVEMSSDSIFNNKSVSSVDIVDITGVIINYSDGSNLEIYNSSDKVTYSFYLKSSSGTIIQDSDIDKGALFNGLFVDGDQSNKFAKEETFTFFVTKGTLTCSELEFGKYKATQITISDYTYLKVYYNPITGGYGIAVDGFSTANYLFSDFSFSVNTCEDPAGVHSATMLPMNDDCSIGNLGAPFKELFVLNIKAVREEGKSCYVGTKDEPFAEVHSDHVYGEVEGTAVLDNLTLNAPDGSDGFLKAENGYTYLPNGMLLQWGKIDFSTSSNTKTITFLKQFSTIPSLVVTPVSDVNSGVSQRTIVIRNDITNADARIVFSDTTVYGLHWIAIGY